MRKLSVVIVLLLLVSEAFSQSVVSFSASYTFPNYARCPSTCSNCFTCDCPVNLTSNSVQVGDKIYDFPNASSRLSLVGKTGGCTGSISESWFSCSGEASCPVSMPCQGNWSCPSGSSGYCDYSLSVSCTVVFSVSDLDCSALPPGVTSPDCPQSDPQGDPQYCAASQAAAQPLLDAAKSECLNAGGEGTTFTGGVADLGSKGWCVRGSCDPCSGSKWVDYVIGRRASDCCIGGLEPNTDLSGTCSPQLPPSEPGYSVSEPYESNIMNQPCADVAGSGYNICGVDSPPGSSDSGSGENSSGSGSDNSSDSSGGSYCDDPDKLINDDACLCRREPSHPDCASLNDPSAGSGGSAGSSVGSSAGSGGDGGGSAAGSSSPSGNSAGSGGDGSAGSGGDGGTSAGSGNDGGSAGSSSPSNVSSSSAGTPPPEFPSSGSGSDSVNAVSCKGLKNCDWSTLEHQLQQLGVEKEIRDSLVKLFEWLKHKQREDSLLAALRWGREADDRRKMIEISETLNGRIFTYYAEQKDISVKQLDQLYKMDSLNGLYYAASISELSRKKCRLS